MGDGTDDDGPDEESDEGKSNQDQALVWTVQVGPVCLLFKKV